jgi:hypothetical protein
MSPGFVVIIQQVVVQLKLALRKTGNLSWFFEAIKQGQTKRAIRLGLCLYLPDLDSAVPTV